MQPLQGVAAVSFCIFVVSIPLAVLAQGPQFSERNRDEAQFMLKAVLDDIRKHYYDAKFPGVNLDKESADAKQFICKATSMSISLAGIATVVDTLNDSHTFFVPPQHAARIEYGWRYEMIGERAFVTQVQPKSDAESKGLKPGDQILSINGYAPSRDTTWKLQYLYEVLRPQPSRTLNLQDPEGKPRTVSAAAHFGKILDTRRQVFARNVGGRSRFSRPEKC